LLFYLAVDCGKAKALLTEFSSGHKEVLCDDTQLVLDCRVMEWFGLEGTLKGPLVQPPAMGRDIL